MVSEEIENVLAEALSFIDDAKSSGILHVASIARYDFIIRDFTPDRETYFSYTTFSLRRTCFGVLLRRYLTQRYHHSGLSDGALRDEA